MTSSKQPLTKKQAEILSFITSYVKENGYSPTYREIADELGTGSTATIHEHIKNLETKGYLTCRGDVARSIEVKTDVLRFSRALNVPLAGLITAGQPIEAIQTDETISVPQDLVGDSDCYVLRVRGDSMVDDGILSGDYVVVENRPAPRDGEIVVALLEGTYATLKRFYKEKGRVRLQPANKTMKPIYAEDVLVQGVVRGVIRNYRLSGA